MRVLLLSPYPERLIPTLALAGDQWSTSVEPLGDESADWVVSFGYRHIIREPHLSRFAGRLVNIHIAALPWNRGADPNFWSWFDGTPKGRHAAPDRRRDRHRRKSSRAASSPLLELTRCARATSSCRSRPRTCSLDRGPP